MVDGDVRSPGPRSPVWSSAPDKAFRLVGRCTAGDSQGSGDESGGRANSLSLSLSAKFSRRSSLRLAAA